VRSEIGGEGNVITCMCCILPKRGPGKLGQNLLHPIEGKDARNQSRTDCVGEAPSFLNDEDIVLGSGAYLKAESPIASDWY